MSFFSTHACVSWTIAQMAGSQLHSLRSALGRPSPKARTSRCSKQHRRCAAPHCTATVQEQPRVSPLQLERQFQRTAAAPAGSSDNIHAAAQDPATQPGASSVSPASGAALRGDAPGNASVEADVVPATEAGSQQLSTYELAAALAALPPSVSSAAVLDGVWLDMHDTCRCTSLHLLLRIAACSAGR